MLLFGIVIHWRRKNEIEMSVSRKKEISPGLSVREWMAQETYIRIRLNPFQLTCSNPAGVNWKLSLFDIHKGICSEIGFLVAFWDELPKKWVVGFTALVFIMSSVDIVPCAIGHEQIKRLCCSQRKAQRKRCRGSTDHWDVWEPPITRSFIPTTAMKTCWCVWLKQAHWTVGGDLRAAAAPVCVLCMSATSTSPWSQYSTL